MKEDYRGRSTVAAAADSVREEYWVGGLKGRKDYGREEYQPGGILTGRSKGYGREEY